MPLALFRRQAPAEPQEINLASRGGLYRVLVRRRADARRITLRVSGATGEIVLIAPGHAAFASLERFAADHVGWIEQRLARLPERVVFAPNALVPLRGVEHRIVHWSVIRGATSATLSPAGEPILAVSGEPAHVRRRVSDFLKGEARRDFDAAVKRHTQALGIPARKIGIRDTRSRWGSCSSNGTLSFSWRLVLAPPFVLDYLAAHEVAHLRELNHSHRFWRLTHQLCPRTEEAERWLKRHGNGLHRYG
jgi:predicted metal-dependent hydrolase